MNKKNYNLTKEKIKKVDVAIEYNKLDGYSIKPRIKVKNTIKVDKVTFIKKELSEKIIRKKIDKKIEYLLKQLKIIEESDEGDTGESIKKTLEEAEKLRIKIIDKYIKYLGHTYESLTLKKIELIVEKLSYKLFENEIIKEEMQSQKEGRRGR